MIHYTEFGQHCHLSRRRSPDRSLRPPFANVISTDGSTGSPILSSHRESAVLRNHKLIFQELRSNSCGESYVMNGI